MTDGAGHFVRWDSCGPIRWVLHQGPGPDRARPLAEQAFERLSVATGLTFVAAGDVDDPVESDDDLPERTIAISWSTPEADDRLGGSIAGYGGPSFIVSSASDTPTVVSGSVVLDATAELSPWFTDGASKGAVLLHELGHVMGLGHVEDPSRLMHPSGSAELSGEYQPGDLAALARAVDRSRCG